MIMSDVRFALLCSTLLLTVSSAVSARGDGLPVPILSDDLQPSTSVSVIELSTKVWVVQLGSGNAATLEAQALSLRADWSDARVVMVAGQAKLVVGRWQSASLAASSLKALRVINVQAFVRQIDGDSQLPLVPTAMPSQAKVKPVKQPDMPTTSSVMPSVIESPLETPAVETKPVISDAEPVVSAQALNDDDILPAIVAVAVANKAELIPETTELQAAVDLLEGQETTLTNQEALPNQLSARETESVVMIVPSEKRDITLPMRSKEPITFQPQQTWVEPLNLMLSPLYLLPTDSNMQANSAQALTMQTVLEALVRPTLVEPQVAPKSTPTLPMQDPALARKAKLFARMAELANAGLWEMALPLVKEAKLKEMTLSSVDNLLLGWVWLQNKEPRVAKGYFQSALKQSQEDEARYALGLCYLLLGDTSAAQDIVKQMSMGKQRDHIRGLLLR
jgi:tetratricopeptide (TPR) repeat protein